MCAFAWPEFEMKQRSMALGRAHPDVSKTWSRKGQYLFVWGSVLGAFPVHGWALAPPHSKITLHGAKATSFVAGFLCTQNLAL